MALTKVRSPVTDIDLMSSGTTNVTIASAGGDISVAVAGVNMLDISSTAVVVDPARTLDASLFTGEQLLLATTSGASATLETQAALVRMMVTNGFPLELGANNITGLTIDTAGKVELDIEGTAVNHLVTKAYVDAVGTGVLANTDFTHVQASTGSLKIPTSTGTDLILNWGKQGIVANGSSTVVTFDLAFPNAVFVGFACSTTAANHDGTLSVSAQALANMTIYSSLDKSSAFDWFAIGY